MTRLAPGWTVALPGWVALPPIVHAGLLHVRAAGHLVAIDPSNGVQRWRSAVDPANDTGRVLVATDDVIVTSRHADRATTLVGLDLDGDLAWETPTESVVVDAHGVVGEHLVTFGARGSATVAHTIDVHTGAIVAEVTLPLRPDRFVAVGDRLVASRRVAPGLISTSHDGSDVRELAADPVAWVGHQHDRLLLSTEHDGAPVVEGRADDLTLVWRRGVGSPVIASDAAAVLVFDADGDATAPRLLDPANGTELASGPYSAGAPEAARVLDDLVAVQMLSALRLLARGPLSTILEVPMARHAVQDGELVIITRMDRLEAHEIRPT